MSVTVYDLANQDVCGRLIELQEVPTAITAFYTTATADELSQLGGGGGGGSGDDDRLETMTNGTATGTATGTASRGETDSFAGRSASPVEKEKPEDDSCTKSGTHIGDGGSGEKEEGEEEEEEEKEGKAVPKVLLLAIGDAGGRVHLLQLEGEFGGSKDVGAKKKNQAILERAIAVRSLFIQQQSFS
jgi:hypothetical protein